MTDVSQHEAREIVAALRTGVVPQEGLHHLATGLDPLLKAVDQELDDVAAGVGSGRAKWIRGAYGSGKTFATRLLCWHARQQGFATSEVQISVTDTPLHRLETVYRRIIERLTTVSAGEGAFQAIVDTWIYQLGDEVMRLQGISEDDPSFPDSVEQRLENKLADLSARNPAFAQVLRAYHRAMEEADFATAQGLLAWLSGEPHVAFSIKKVAAVKGDVDGAAALTFLRGLLRILRDTGYQGLVVVLDEAETIQRMRSDVREKALNALRQLVDSLLKGELPGLYFVVTGTPEFYDGYKGLVALPPLADRVKTRFSGDPRHDNLRAPQVRLQPFDAARLTEVGRKVRALYPAESPKRVRERVNDDFVEQLVEKTTSAFGGRVEVVPRLFLRELVDVMDRVDQYADYDPFNAYNFAVSEAQMTPEELAALHGEDTARDTAGDFEGDAGDGDRGQALAGGDAAPQPKRLD